MIELKVVHRQRKPNPNIQEVTIRREDLPPLRNLGRGGTMVSVEGEQWFACPGLKRVHCDCETTGAKKGDWILRVRR